MLFSDFESDIKRAHPTNLPIISHFLEDRMGTGTKPQGGNSTHQERRFLKGLGGRGNFSLRSSQPPDFQSALKGHCWSHHSPQGQTKWVKKALSAWTHSARLLKEFLPWWEIMLDNWYSFTHSEPAGLSLTPDLPSRCCGHRIIRGSACSSLVGSGQAHSRPLAALT